ncbi:hypothetical protein [Simiduia aestuariiviva]|uniref:Uncharacterized protein n=1 Tax=Simiduia aestuariiviva TaxID=1510459 RepID=A0A839ULF0_9GAMM|nr:hypothetical protein [Simiduia aestuariiviva]MBB3168493.1 hypothetical protein [Simiduia aestuariiviva]
MGLFSRSQPEDNENDLLDSPGLPTSQDLNNDFFEPETTAAASPAPKVAKRNLSYGIEDAIGLMRKLPKDNAEVVVSVVKQTLESTNISIDDIIADATDKEERLLNKNTQLEKEIKELQAQIAARNKHISQLLADHKETVSVREQLQLANKLTAPKKPPLEAQKTPVKPASPMPAAAKPETATPTTEPSGNNPLAH